MNLKCLIFGHESVIDADAIKDPAGAIVQPIHCERCGKALDYEIEATWFPNPDAEVNEE